MLNKEHKLHFIGIGGVGMSAIAYVLRQQGYEISGSDLKENSMTLKLRGAGVKLFIGHSGDNLPDISSENPGLVIVSSAIKESNVELQEARRRGIKVWHRAQMLAELFRQGVPIAISGSHGKTTTTSMVSLILEKAGVDPTILIGGEVADIGGNAKLGKGPYIVAEADESDGSFLQLYPVYAVVTNIEPEHLDYYQKYESLLEAFGEFIDRIPEQGKVILCADDVGLRQIMPRLNGRFLSYSVKAGGGLLSNGSAGDKAEPDFTSTDVSLHEWGSRFKFHLKGHLLGEVELTVPGLHNVYNATAAIGLCLYLGLAFDSIKKGIYAFKGAQRRFEIIGQSAGISIIDDYGHHPTEVAATINTARLVKKSGRDRVIAIFQPHRYTRTQHLGRNFAPSFQDADQVIITDIYSAGEAPIKGISGKLIYDSVVQRGHPNAIYIPQKGKICDYILPRLRSGDLLLTIGAGDIRQVGFKIVRLLKKRTSHHLPQKARRAKLRRKWAAITEQ